MATNNNDNNIYLFILNKYERKDKSNFSEYIKTVSKMKKDEKWEQLTEEEQQRLISKV